MNADEAFAILEAAPLENKWAVSELLAEGMSNKELARFSKLVLAKNEWLMARLAEMEQ
jgi:hypothetical protein